MIIDRMEFEGINGVKFEEENLYLTHQFFVDNVTAIIEANARNVKNLQEQFDKFGNVSGLKCDQQATSAVHLGRDALSLHLANRQWYWKGPDNYSKLLGLYFGEGISTDLTLLKLIEKMEARLVGQKKNPRAFMARVLAANQIIGGSQWYQMTLYSGSKQDLKKIGKTILNFLWAGQKESTMLRMDIDMLSQPKRKGGVGLIPSTMHVQCLPTKMVIFAMEDGDVVHPLQVILRDYSRIYH